MLRETETQKGRRRCGGRWKPGDQVPEGKAKTLKEAAIKKGGLSGRDRRDREREGETDTRGGDGDRWRHRDTGVTETERSREGAED